MVMVFFGIKYDRVLIFDAEYNTGDLIQFSGFLFRNIATYTYQLEKTLTTYVKIDEELNPFIRRFTGITDNFLNKYGVDLKVAQEQIRDLIDVGDDSLLVVSHGLQNDRSILLDNGVDLYYDKNDNLIDGSCTCNMAGRILKRDSKIKLIDVAEEAGFYLNDGHNAFHDVIATVVVFSFLLKIQEDMKNEKENV